MISKVDRGVADTRNFQSILNQYRPLTSGNLFPCHERIIGDPSSKAPLHPGFTKRRYSDIQLETYLDDGHALGWCVGKDYVVMDVDVATPERPDKQGDKSLAKLEQDLGVDFSDVPQVHSPTGGRHYYMKRPNDLRLRKVLKDYPDIEFITGSGYVLIAGSPHWQGETYEFDEDTDALGLDPVDCPGGLLDLLVKTQSASSEHSEIEPEDLAKLLSHLDPERFAAYDEWLEIAIASHDATNGRGLIELDAWSKNSHAYSSETRVEEQWDSFEAGSEGGFTLKTLLYHVREAAAQMGPNEAEAALTTVSKINAHITFDDLPDDPESEEADDDDPEDDGKSKTPKFALPENNLSFAALAARGVPEHDYIVSGVLVADQLMYAVAPQKCNKTSIILDLGFSIATGTPFLGVFPVPRKRNVKFISVESGETTLMHTGLQILKSKGLTPADAQKLTMGFEIVECSNPLHLRELKKLLIRENTEVLIVDPAYLTLLAGSTEPINSGDVNAMGAAIRRFNDVCKAAGTTPILIHHTRKSDRHSRCETTELDDSSGAGPREFARQWILLSRRARYAFDGHHELRMDVGGSAGHSGCYAVDVETGRFADPLDVFDDFDDEPTVAGDDSEPGTQRPESSGSGGLTWRVEVARFQDHIEGEKQQKAAAKASEEQGKIDRVVEFLESCPDGETLTQIRDSVGIGAAVARRIVDQLVADGTVIEIDVKKGNRSRGGYRIATSPRASVHPSEASVCQTDGCS